MRVLACKIHCPSFICFCKPSAASHLYTSGPFKLENSPHAPHSQHLSPVPVPVPVPVAHEFQVKEVEEGGDRILRSCMKKVPVPSSSASLVVKKKVQWVDSLGKQLVDIKEFGSSETGDTDNEEESGGCLCNIL